MFAPPKMIETKVFVRVPGSKILEGPSFDRAGNLYVVDIPNGRVFRIGPAGAVKMVAEYDGVPNGLKIHRDGRIFIADRRYGLVNLDPDTGRTSIYLDRPHGESFKGLNDLVFGHSGRLYFTDQGESGLHDPTGRVFRLDLQRLKVAERDHYKGAGMATQGLDCLLHNVPSPNGLVVTPDESVMYLAAIRSNAIWRVPLLSGGGVGRVGTWLQLSGGVGPDGLALDIEGRLVVAHSGMGAAWVFDSRGEPVFRIKPCEGLRITNLAYGGPQNRTLFMTEADSGSIQMVELDVPGCPMFSHLDKI